MQQAHPVLVVGAGPTGLTAALELARWGIPVRIVEKAAMPATTSRALALQARTLELFSQRGLTDEMLALGNPVKAAMLYGERKPLGRIELDRIASRFNYVLMLAQSETERLLREQLTRAGIHIERPVELMAFSQPESAAHPDRSDGVRAVLRHADGRLELCDASYLICAEGAHSLVRHTLNLPFEGKSLEQSYVLADLHIEAHLPDDELALFFSEHGLLGLFPMGAGRFRLIASNPHHHPADAADPPLAELQQLYDTDSHIPARLHDVAWSSRFRINSRMLHTLSAGRVFFGGDAAHIHSPAGGQGMNTGIQDMINLGWKLALVCRGYARPELLDSYTQERLPVIRRVLGTTEKATQAATATRAFFRQLMVHVAPWLLDFDQVQQAGARTISQISIDYRASTLSETQAAPGQLYAGDRMPDMDVIADGAKAASIYSLLDPARFTVILASSSPDIDLPREWTSLVKVIRIRAAEGAENHDRFAQAFGAEFPLLAVRPDAYVGYVQARMDSAEFRRWFAAQFANNADSAPSQAPPATSPSRSATRA